MIYKQMKYQGGETMIAQFIAILFLSWDIAHREHLRTKSFAQHEALGSFYSAIVDLTDSLTEMYQGRNGIIDLIPQLNDDDTDKTPSQLLKKYLALIEKSRYTAVEKTDSALQNKIDEIVGQFLSTIYKLDNLK